MPKLSVPTYGTGSACSSSTHVRSGHDKATFQLSNDFEFCEDDTKVCVEDAYDVSQLLAATRGIEGNLEARSEIDVQELVKRLLEDVLAAQNWTRNKIQREVRLVSFRPDILVVAQRDGSVLGFIEVKMPAKAKTERDNLHTDEGVASKVGGQLYDYLETLWNMGVENPVGMLHTLDTCRVVWSKHGYPNKSAGRWDTSSLLSMCTDNSPPLSPPPAVLYPGPSLPQAANDASSSDESKSCSSSGEDEEGAHRRLHSSIPYDTPKEVVQATTAALRLMVSAKLNSKRREVPMHNTTVKRMSLPIVSKEGIQYSSKLKTFALNFTKGVSKLDKLHLLHEIGRGRNALCFVAVDEEGNAGALKVYIRKDDQSSCDFRAETWSRAEKEAVVWNQVHDKCFRARVFPFNYLGKDAAALLMPYCRPLGVEERISRLEAVKDALRKLAKAGYYYHDGDVRWRHIACRGLNDSENSSVVLLDLDNLKELCDVPHLSVDEIVKKHIDLLRKRCKSQY